MNIKKLKGFILYAGAPIADDFIEFHSTYDEALERSNVLAEIHTTTDYIIVPAELSFEISGGKHE